MSAPQNLMKFTVTILINNYNYDRFLHQAIDSALAQTYPLCEVVVVDDGSTDDSREIISSYSSRIIPVFKENGGQGSAYNAGFAVATGDIIMFLDSDDYLMPNAAERIIANWHDGTQILHHRLMVVDLNGKELGYWPAKPETLDSGDVVPTMLRNGFYSSPPSSGLAYGRELLKKMLPMPANFAICADAWLYIKGPFLAPVAALDETLGCYRLHGNNNWGTAGLNRLSSRKRLHAFITAQERNCELIKTCAGARGLSYDTRKWENAYTLRWKLILMRLGMADSNSKTRRAVVGRILNKIWSAPYTLPLRVKETILTMIIWTAPHAILGVIFPNMFGKGPVAEGRGPA